MTSYRAYDRRNLDEMPGVDRMSAEQRLVIKAVSAVLPFRVNSHVVENLIDWDDVPNDPIYQLTFPQAGMLDRADLDVMVDLVRRDAPAADVRAAAHGIQQRLNPHPGGQRDLNVPLLDGVSVPGMQHKYADTVLLFPQEGQTCHAYCGYCFRWAQFVGNGDLKFKNREEEIFARYLREHPEVTDVLVTGGDPLVMRTQVLRRYIEPLLGEDLRHIQTLRIGTKALAFWPGRFLDDPDADDLLRLFERVVKSGRHLALMAHFSHPRELDAPAARAALARIQATGAVVRCQAPLVRHVNDSVETWTELWQKQVQLGAIPYYMFMERDTGPRDHFELPIARALAIFQGAYARVSGLARSVRGPVMSTTAGKVLVEGTATIAGEQAFVLKFTRPRAPEDGAQVFFAKLDPTATWFDQLRPLGDTTSSSSRTLATDEAAAPVIPTLVPASRLTARVRARLSAVARQA